MKSSMNIKGKDGKNKGARRDMMSPCTHIFIGASGGGGRGRKKEEEGIGLGRVRGRGRRKRRG